MLFGDIMEKASNHNRLLALLQIFFISFVSIIAFAVGQERIILTNQELQVIEILYGIFCFTWYNNEYIRMIMQNEMGCGY
jgi:hypothetical protein